MHERRAIAAQVGLLAALAILAAPALAQTPRFDRSEPTEITADVIEYFQDRDVYVADGNVRVVQGDRVLETRWAAFGATTRIGVASGDVVYRAGGETVTARFLRFEVDTLDGVVYGAELDLGEQGFRIGAEELVRTGEDRYRILDARFTACRCPDPEERLPWELHSACSDVHVGGYGTSRNTTVEVLGVPVVWLPWILYPVKTERQTGLLVPTVSFGGRNGLDIGLPFFWAARRNVNVVATPSWSSRRGFKQDLEIETVYGEGSRTELRGAFLHDQGKVNRGHVPIERSRPTATQPDGVPIGAIRDRGFGAVEHDQDLPLGARFKIDGAWVSDNQYVLDFDGLEERRRDRYLDSHAFAFDHVGGDGRLGLQLAGHYANDLQDRDGQDRDDFLLQRYADVEAQWLSGPVGGLPWLSAGFDVDYEYFGRERDPARVLVAPPPPTNLRFYDVGIAAQTFAPAPNTPGLYDEGEPLADTGHRLTVHPRLGVPLRLFDTLEWFSEGGYRQTLYWSDLQGYEERGQITGRSELSMRLARSYERVGRAPLEHQLVPRLEWAFVDSERGQKLNPLFTPQTQRLQTRVRQQALDNVVLDRADVVASANRVVVGVDNRFYVGRGAGRRFAGELGLSVARDFRDGRFGQVIVEGRGLEWWRMRPRFLVAFDPESGRVDEGLAQLWTPLVGRMSLNVRYRYLRDAPRFFEQFQSASGTRGRPDSFDRISQLSGSLDIPFLDRFILRYHANYSFEGSQFLTNAGTLDYVSQCGCWAAGVEVSESRNEGLRVRFRYTVLGFGDDIANPFGSGAAWIGQ